MEIFSNIHPNQWAPMQSLVHSVWHTQHHSYAQPALVHTMCMHPPDIPKREIRMINYEYFPLILSVSDEPSRSVGVLHLGHGFDIILIVTLEASSHRASVAFCGSIEYDGWAILVTFALSDIQSPIWYPCKQSLQNTNYQPRHASLRPGTNFLRSRSLMWSDHLHHSHFHRWSFYNPCRPAVPCHSLVAGTAHRRI